MLAVSLEAAPVYSMTASTALRRAHQSPDTVTALESLLSEWCKDIETYVDNNVGNGNGNRGEAMAMQGGNDDTSVDVGPNGELKYWRGRMQRLQSVHEQLNLPHCRRVVDFMSALSRGSVMASALTPSLSVASMSMSNSTSSLSVVDPDDPGVNKARIAELVQRWNRIDEAVTETANEAKDNVKYLFSLRRFFDPLYNGTPQNIMDSIPALLNSIKIIHTIARYYNTNERMTTLFVSITDQMIVNCKEQISNGGTSQDLWDRESEDLITALRQCVKLNDIYQEQYRATKAKVETSSGDTSKPFDFNEMQIFGKFDLFCRRVNKLIDMFATIQHFTGLADNKLEGMEPLLERFFQVKQEFREREHDLLDYHNNRFDRDYVEFNVQISDLVGELQHFIDASFENIYSVGHSLNLLRKFRSILPGDTLKVDLDSKLTVILHNYGLELDMVQRLYDKQRHDPPIARNMPPVAGNIGWSRHLMKRIEEPIAQFEASGTVLSSKGAMHVVKIVQ